MQSNAINTNNHNKNSFCEFIYIMGKQSISDRQNLEKTTNELDQSIQLTNDLKLCTQAKYAANKVDSILGMLKKPLCTELKAQPRPDIRLL